MVYEFRYNQVFRHFDVLLEGAWLTVQLSASAMALGLLIAIACALIKTDGPRPARLLVNAYVEVIRNTPFLVQIFIVFFGLPNLGLRLSASQAALIGLSINLGAYATEIVRAGIESIPRGQIEAGVSLGLSRLQVFRYVIIMPALKAIYPALSSQFIILMLASSIVSQISAEELFHSAAFLESRTFLNFEIYSIVAVMYLVLSIAFRGALNLVRLAVFRRP
ncbi:MAG: amino acid ABC transporter permease [Alphaproteobacteria bacterium]|nr:amino acid ABC transporter permease [Alphaproteobacteria bacterium]